jgi:general secretion pathway protein J
VIQGDPIQPEGQGGFTLVELLLAMTLMSVLLALAYGGLSAATKSSERGQLMLEQSSQLRITHQFIRKQLNLMLPLAFEAGDEEQTERYVFTGTPQRIQFVGPMPGYLGNGGPQVQVLELVNGDDGLDLLFSHARLQEFEEERLFDRDPVVLLEGLAEAGFEFLELDETGESTAWMSDWPNPTVHPLAVRLSLDLGEQSRVTWPPLVAAVRLDDAAVIPGTEGRQDYTERIQEMIRRQAPSNKD